MASQSTVATHLSEEELFQRWTDRWDHFLDDFSATSSSSTISELLRDKVKSGNAERAIAGGHEGREILELLQNARDAIPGETDGGRVYVGVYDEGVLVANTGRPFDLFDPDVEDAVTMIGESSKGNSDQEIGHKGVGLKSILATGDAFETWTRHENATNGTLRVRLSRSYVTAALLSSLGCDTSTFDLRGSVSDEAIQSLTTTSNADQRTEELTLDSRKDIGKLPLFDFPVPLTMDAGVDDPVADRASALLAGDVDEWYGDPFRTAVFVEYEDSEWRDILEEFDIPQPESSDRDSAGRAERLWSYLSKELDDEGETSETLRAETLVQFGGIDTLLLERVDETNRPIRERWDVDRTPGPLDSETVRHETVTVAVEGTDTTFVDEQFDQFGFADADASTQLLVPQTSTEQERSQEYPLYLYYPIENTRDVSLPFCLHGHFTVETNRKDLSLNSLDENQAVLERGVELVARVAEAAGEHEFGDRYPWILLPPPPKSSPDDPSSQASLLIWFRAAVYKKLREQPCIPTVSDESGISRPVVPDESLLHWDSTVRDGFLALFEVMDSLDEPVSDAVVDRHFLTKDTLEGCRSFPDTWEERIEALLWVDDIEQFSTEIARSWGAILGSHLDKRTVGQDTSHLVCDASTARALFVGTIETILRSGSNDEELSATLDMLSSHLEGVYLLPCRRTDENEIVGDDSEATREKSDTTDSTLLVPIEARSGPNPNERGTSRTRSVIWDVNSPERDTQPPEVPREKSSFRVYFLDRTIEQNERARRVLDLAGRPWGVRVYDGTPSYFRELLDTFATDDPARVKALDFYFLAKQVNKLGSESSDLQTDEGSFVPTEYVKSAVARSDGDQRQNLRRRLNLRNNCLTLPRDGGTHTIRETILGDDWQRIRALAHGDDATEEWDTFDGTTSTTWPAPTDETWVPIAGALQADGARERIAKTLSLFGVSVLPDIRTVWMYGSGHPRTRGDASWDPVEWSADDFLAGDGVPESAGALQRSLADAGNVYQQWITAPGRHPQTTAEHSSKCNVKTDGVLRDVFLATWIWFDDLDAVQQLGEDNLLELLHRYEGQFSKSILETGWTCSHGHQRDGYGWSKSVPTLLNWQLRQLAVWDSTVTTHPELRNRWGDDATRLAYTVIKTGSRGARASRLFPHTDPDDLDLSEELLNKLGVKTIDSFDATEATWYLHRLLEVLAVDALNKEPVALDVPDDRDNDWNAAYTALLEPILRQLPAEDPTEEDVDLPFLSHLPIKRGGEWQVASLEWLAENANKGRYYEDQSPKPWERRAVEQGGHWLLPRTASGPFTRLTNALGIARVDASKPIFDADKLIFTDDSVGEFRSALRDRMVLLVASLEQRSEDRIREFADDLDAAIAELRVAEQFPEVIEDDLDAPKSGLYAPRDGEEAFVFNSAAFDDGLTLDGLANAVSLLAEQPTTIATFREALDDDLSPAELTKRWQRRTFPVDDVARILGTRRRRDLRQRLEAIVSLVERFDGGVAPTVDDVVEAIEREDDTAVQDFKRAVCGDEVTTLDRTSPQGMFVRDVRESLPQEMEFVLNRLFGEDRRPWREVILESEGGHELVVIDWLAKNARTLDATTCFPQSVLSAYVRVLAVMDVWDRTETTALNDVEVWRSRLRDLSTESNVEWVDRLPDRLQNQNADGELLFYYSPADRFQSMVVNPFLERLSGAIASETADLETMLRQYILEGELPENEATVSAADHQDGALADLQSAAMSGQQFSTESLLDAGFEVQSASTRTTGSRGGSGSTQYRGRGQQGEAATLVAILDDTAAWLEDQPNGMIRMVRSKFRALYDDQQTGNHNWHLDRVWDQELLPLIAGGGLTRDSVVNWREHIGDGPLRDHPLVRLCNVTLEQGPGFDVIDPFGPLSGPRQEFDIDHFAPVEVKAVGGRSPPFHFRLTTNEYRRCKAFLRNDRPYVIRLVYVPAPGTPNWESETKFVSEIVLEDVSDAESLVHGNPFEEIVKGGYMNMSVDQ
jgi:hypothetical protein